MQPKPAAVVAVWMVLGCGGGGGGTAGQICVPGMSVACSCSNAAQGAQTCTSDGERYGACMCTTGPDVGGGSGSGRTGGTGGGAGAAGIAGSSSVGGSGATAGTSGVGTGGSFTGAAGSGPAGRGGSGGATGTGGTTGTAGNGGAPVNCANSSAYNGRYASVTFKDAIIGPGKEDQTSWDGTFTIPNSVLNAVGTALAGGDPVGGTLAVLAGPTLNAAIDATAKPDAYGWVSGTAFGVMGDAYYLAQPSAAIQDSYTPIWPGTGLTFSNVPIDCDVRFDVTLMDSDLVNDDPIGTPEINSSDLEDALAAQQKFYVRVDDQTAQQLLFLGISVVLQSGPR